MTINQIRRRVAPTFNVHHMVALSLAFFVIWPNMATNPPTLSPGPHRVWPPQPSPLPPAEVVAL